MLEPVTFSPLVNQWYPANGPSGDGANTKSNYKDGWHHSDWWRQRLGLPEAADTKVLGLSCAAFRLEGRRNISFRMIHSCVLFGGLMLEFDLNSKSWTGGCWLTCLLFCGILPKAQIWLWDCRRHKPAEPFFFSFFATLPAGTAPNNLTALQHLSKKYKRGKCIKTLELSSHTCQGFAMAIGDTKGRHCFHPWAVSHNISFVHLKGKEKNGLIEKVDQQLWHISISKSLAAVRRVTSYISFTHIFNKEGWS